VLPSRTRARRGRSAGALLCASLSLAAALALAAPLVHAHLAASDVTRDLCGDHHPESGFDPSGDGCSLCLAGAHAPALRDPGAPGFASSPDAPTRFAIVTRAQARGIALDRPGTPRAPPHSA
jgi:hypothetical protein